MRVAAEGLTWSSCGCIPGAHCSIGSRGEDLASIIDGDKPRREHSSYLTLQRRDGSIPIKIPQHWRNLLGRSRGRDQPPTIGRRAQQSDAELCRKIHQQRFSVRTDDSQPLASIRNNHPTVGENGDGVDRSGRPR